MPGPVVDREAPQPAFVLPNTHPASLASCLSALHDTSSTPNPILVQPASVPELSTCHLGSQIDSVDPQLSR